MANMMLIVIENVQIDSAHLSWTSDIWIWFLFFDTLVCELWSKTMTMSVDLFRFFVHVFVGIKRNISAIDYNYSILYYVSILFLMFRHDFLVYS